MRVRVADGPAQRIGDMGAQHLPGEEVWVVGEHRSTGERKYYLSNLPADTPLKQPRRRHQGALGLRAGASATQGRARPRPLRRAIMDGPPPTRADDDDRLRLPAIPPPQAGQGGKRIPGPPPQPSLPAIRQAILSPSHRRRPLAVPTVADPYQLKICQSSASAVQRVKEMPTQFRNLSLRP